MKFILDIDGTIIENNEPINQSVEFLKQLNRDSIDFLIATNSIRSHKVQVERLHNLGIDVSINSIFTPIDSINAYLSDKKIDKAFIIGSKDEIDQIECTNTDINPKMIVLLDFKKADISHKILQQIIDITATGVPIITASPSISYISGGKTIIDTGSYAKLIERVANVKISVIGKPSTIYFHNAMKRFSSFEEIWMIGDDIETDILGGQKAGLKTALVKSGKYQSGDEQKSHPDKVINNLSDLFD